MTGIDAELFRHRSCRRHLLEDPLPDAALRPPVVAVIDRCMRSILRGAIAPAASGLKDMQDATDHPAITRGLPGLPRGRWGSIAAQASSDNHNKCVIAASLSVELKEAAIRRKNSMCCMSSQPRPCTHKSRLVSGGWSMSSFPPKADTRQPECHVRYVGECAGGEQAAQIAIALFADAT